MSESVRKTHNIVKKGPRAQLQKCIESSPVDLQLEHTNVEFKISHKDFWKCFMFRVYCRYRFIYIFDTLKIWAVLSKIATFERPFSRTLSNANQARFSLKDAQFHIGLFLGLYLIAVLKEATDKCIITHVRISREPPKKVPCDKIAHLLA